MILRIFFSIILPLGLIAQSAKPKINFNYNIHDFGMIKENDGVVSYEFEFTNEGNTQLIISNVVASCGCTVPFWSKEPISPRSKGKIKVEFNPFNKPGPFNKTLTVYSNASNEVVILNVIGNVLPKPKRITDDFPDVLGNLRLLSRYLNFGDINTAIPTKKEFTFYNQMDSMMIIEKVIFNNQYLNVTIEPLKLLPKTKGKIIVEYDAQKRNDFGPLNDKFEIVTNDKAMPIKALYCSVNIKKYFPDYNKSELEQLAKIKLEKSIHDFGTIKQGEKVTTSFQFTNIGKDNLIIYKVKPSCGCTVVDIDKKVIHPNETGKISITFDSYGKEGIQEKHLTIYTNDPTNHAAVFSIKAKIAK